ncbi:hypothetical protein ACFLRB_02570 [Acidobacteriota bacterium]
MLCIIHKWFVSRSLDTGKKLPGFVSSHLRHCGGCREFHQLSGSLSRRLARDGEVYLLERDEFLNERINSALTAKPQPVVVKKRNPAQIFVPAFAAALFVFVVAMGVILQNTKGVAPGANTNPLTGISELVPGKRASLPEIVGRVESPMESEMTGLKKSVGSAAKFLISYLDIKINPE